MSAGLPHLTSADRLWRCGARRAQRLWQQLHDLGRERPASARAGQLPRAAIDVQRPNFGRGHATDAAQHAVRRDERSAHLGWWHLLATAILRDVSPSTALTQPFFWLRFVVVRISELSLFASRAVAPIHAIRRCGELGIMILHDFMLSWYPNIPYPAYPAYRARIKAEVKEKLTDLAVRIRTLTPAAEHSLSFRASF